MGKIIVLLALVALVSGCSSISVGGGGEDGGVYGGGSVSIPRY